MLEKVDSGYKDIKEYIVSVRMEMKKKADSLYKKGVKYFINEELQKAINEWTEALELDPGRIQIKEDIKNARHLLEKLDQIDQ